MDTDRPERWARRATVPGLAPLDGPPLVREPLTPEETKKLAAQREQGIRAGTAVVEQVVSTGRLTQEDGIALAIATAKLDGPDAAKVYAKLSMAINEGRVRPEKDAFSF